ncbi:hypothetical protein CDAR_60981 [Caerostris darwini]|uniref:Uncharacterized protein n=1 Tax=Caerostris darwini TaxID=1538125 RepID=A0AAV4RWR3_9ARAC|nr:hypothetical protein CDAR_60981 [Caerostris darwini]
MDSRKRQQSPRDEVGFIFRTHARKFSVRKHSDIRKQENAFSRNAFGCLPPRAGPVPRIFILKHFLEQWRPSIVVVTRTDQTLYNGDGLHRFYSSGNSEMNSVFTVVYRMFLKIRNPRVVCLL